jgi:signal transduction histidine kinase
MDQKAEHPSATLVAHMPTALASVVVVDHDATTAETLAAVLRHDGYAVRIAATVRDARRLLEETAPDVLFLSLDAERPARLDLLATLRERFAETSVIILASYAGLDAALSAVKAGVYDYLEYLMKPVDVDDLRNTLRRALERQRLQRENRELIEAQELHEMFVAMVAHEMRGPLNPIINYAQMATRHDLPHEKLENYMSLIVEHAFRLNRLIDDLRIATRLSTGQFALRRGQVDVCAAVEEVVEQFTSSTYERHFSLERPDEAILAEVDRDRLVQAVRNLVDNAVKYTADDGAIEVRVWQDTDRVYISVADYGAGLTKEEMARIFDPFIRGAKSQEVSGSGLGLYITRGIAEAHGGHLTVRNRAGDQRAQGAIFTIALPLKPTPPTEH